MKRFLEVELKYRASNIKLSDFVSCVAALGDHTILNVSSHDYYFVKDENTFIRYRTGEKPELTMKRKLVDTNNFMRVETNLRLESKTSAEEQLRTVEKFCELLSFEHNFTIYKTCFIYYFKNFNVVYYLVYDNQMKEQDRFIEIEMDENYPWKDQDECWSALISVEKALTPLGITPANRIRKSLFEMFRK